MERIFLPVGQGAFYLERFCVENEYVNVVYDCGSLTNERVLISRIDSCFFNNKSIAAMFVSHMDRDHINGLPHLLKRCNVERLFLPFITEENKRLIIIDDLIENGFDNSFFTQFISNPQKACKDITHNETSPQIYWIKEPGDNKELNDDSFLESGKNIAGYVFGGKLNTWEYIPFNFRQEKGCEELKTAIKELNMPYDSDALLAMMKKDNGVIDSLKKAYKKVKGGLNTNSMTLLSVYRGEYVFQHLLRPIYWRCYKCCNTPNGCLYTGDYDAHNQMNCQSLIEKYSEYSDYIGCVQIPHHGSFHNYNKDLLNHFNCKFVVISSGINNKYGHPHKSVLLDIISKGIWPLVVSEDGKSMVEFVIDYM